MSEFRKGQYVETGSKRGIILETHSGPTTFTYDGDEFQVDDGDEMYVVAHEDGTDVFSVSKISSSEWGEEIDADPEEATDAKANAYNPEKMNALEGRKMARMRHNALGFDSWPDSWEKSNKPARLIALDAWFSMGGTWTSCFRELHKKRLCAAFKDEIYQTTQWREGGD